MSNAKVLHRTYPLLPSQEGIYFAWMSRPEATCWNLPVCMAYDHEINSKRLLDAVRAIVSHRDTLHLRLTIDEEGHPRQYIDPDMSIDVIFRETSEADALDYRDHHFVRPFVPFGDEPLCRFEILRTPEHHYLLFDIHHLIGDGVTISHVFLGQDLPRAYAGLPLNRQDYDMLDEALSQESSFNSERYKTDRRYYHDRFQNRPFTPLSSIPSNPWGQYLRSSTFIEKEAIDQWCEKNAVGPNHLFSTAFSLVLSRLSGEREVAFLTLFHGRKDRRLRTAWGMFVSTLPQLMSHEPTDTIGRLLSKHRQEQFQALRHSVYPLTHFCNDLHRAPMTTFGFQSGHIPESIALDGRLYPGKQLTPTESRNELSCMIYVHEHAYEVRVDASSAWHDTAYLERFAKAVGTIVNQLTTQTLDARLDQLSLIDEVERKQLTVLDTGEPLAWPEKETLASLILRQCERTPSSIAVSDGHGSMTYLQLSQASGHLACSLRHLGIGHGDIVAIALPHDHRFLVTALGVMRSGAAYLPIDTSHPPLHRQQLLEDSGARLLIDDVFYPSMESESSSIDNSLETIDLSRPDDMAYLLYTSGTTGTPKGVMISHRALCHFVFVTAHLWHLDASSRISCHASFTFDASVEDLYPALTCGGTVYLPDDATRHDLESLRRYIADHHITGGCYTPQHAMLLTEGHPLDVDYLCVGGDRMTQIPSTNGRLLNTYGPTEFTVNATYHDVDKNGEGIIPIGRPLPNLCAFVMDYAGHLLPKGMIGELCLGGPQKAMGYWKRPEETAQRFTYVPSVNMTLYHTGDYVRWNDKGLLEFIGRRDEQLELNGQRIEPSEVESALCHHASISDASVSIQTSGGQGILCAHYICSEKCADITSSEDMEPLENELKHYLRQHLPPYMIPQLWQRVEHLPLNANGKVERKHLPPIVNKVRHIVTAPANNMEERLLSLFHQVLERDDVGVTDNFFDVGGTSLSAMELVSKARESHLGVDYAMLYRWGDVRSLSAHLVKSSDSKHGLWHIPQDFTPIPIPSMGQGHERPIGNLLLTGSTGFLGSHVLTRYLCQEQGTVYCLVRDSDEIAARERLLRIVETIIGEKEAERLAHRIVVIPSDLCRDDAFEPFEGIHVDTVIHCAANVNHYAPQEALWAVNVEGTRRVLHYCLRHGIHLLHLSTLSVGGIDEEGRFLSLTEQEYYRGQSFVEPYDYSKFMSEHIVLEAISHDLLSATIVRPGFIVPSVGHPHLVPNRNDLLMSLDHMAGKLGFLPSRLASIPIAYCSVEEAADEVFAMSKHRNGRIIRHLRHLRHETFGEMMLSRHPALRWVEDDEFMRLCGPEKMRSYSIGELSLISSFGRARIAAEG